MIEAHKIFAFLNSSDAALSLKNEVFSYPQNFAFPDPLFSHDSNLSLIRSDSVAKKSVWSAKKKRKNGEYSISQYETEMRAFSDVDVNRQWGGAELERGTAEEYAGSAWRHSKEARRTEEAIWGICLKFIYHFCERVRKQTSKNKNKQTNKKQKRSKKKKLNKKLTTTTKKKKQNNIAHHKTPVCSGNKCSISLILPLHFS